MNPTSTDLPSDRELFYLKALSKHFPNEASSVCEIASLRALLTLPMGSIHVISDVHGEAKKLRHVINNASGNLRPLVEQLFADRLSGSEIRNLLTMIYYPREAWESAVSPSANPDRRRDFFRRVIGLEFEVMREVARRSTARRIESVFPDKYRGVFRELFFELPSDHGEPFGRAMLDTMMGHGLALDFLRHVSRAIRNLSIFELIVAGDCGDRGPRLDQVMKTIMHQPDVAFTWGNHDMTWMGAGLGDPLMIATVLRISLRYRRLSQLEEGFGIMLSPLEKLARTCYADDPATRFQPKGDGLRDDRVMARMQKAIAVIDFKLQGQLIERNPHYGMDDRNLLPKIDFDRGVLEIDGVDYRLLDRSFPTIDPSDPLTLSREEQICMDRIRESFLGSNQLWYPLVFLEKKGSMVLRRDDNLIFHGCLAVDDKGEFLPMMIDGEAYVGRAMLLKLNSVVHRSFRERRREDLDLLWYLWAGPNSPLFGKDKMATLERYLLEEKSTHKETKNPYFQLIHEKDFCEKVLREFEVDPTRGLIINGHVPVKIDDGEDPLKRSGMAITIDGAFSEAYGDRGYTLLLESTGVTLAQHHHFESVEEAVAMGTEIIPKVTRIRSYETEKTVGDTFEAKSLEERIRMLERLVEAYRESLISESV